MPAAAGNPAGRPDGSAPSGHSRRPVEARAGSEHKGPSSGLAARRAAPGHTSPWGSWGSARGGRHAHTRCLPETVELTSNPTLFLCALDTRPQDSLGLVSHAGSQTSGWDPGALDKESPLVCGGRDPNSTRSLGEGLGGPPRTCTPLRVSPPETPPPQHLAHLALVLALPREGKPRPRRKRTRCISPGCPRMVVLARPCPPLSLAVSLAPGSKARPRRGSRPGPGKPSTWQGGCEGNPAPEQQARYSSSGTRDHQPLALGFS